MRSGPATQSDILSVTPAFKKEVTRSIAAIIAFLFAYFILFGLSLLLVTATVRAGVWIISREISTLSFLLGAGIISIGVLVFVFLIKFLFSRSKHDNSDKVPINEEDQPELVSFIHSIAEQTGTDKPKKIFLSSDVNACVFYDSSFWSMFLPVRKNLQVGLGLVNCVNVSEFKAVLAHEFGHFSQKSMKLGSYAYQVNKILHDMLFNNNGFYNWVRTWSSLSWITWLFAVITVQIIKAIQFILVQMYKVVNKSYLSLSRQMEFHADLVAASIAGSNNIVSALKRIEFGEVCFQSTLAVYGQQWKEKKMMQNLYSDQRTVLKNLATANNIPLDEGLPRITDEGKDMYFTRVNFKDQWASHPELSEREAYLNTFSLTSDSDNRSAWTLFRNPKQLQISFTESMYELQDKGNSETLDTNAFEQVYLQQIQLFELPAVYKGYYNNRLVAEFDTAIQGELLSHKTLEDILTEDICRLPLRVQSMKADVEKLRAILDGTLDVTSFDFDGERFKKKQAAEILATLEQELEELTRSLNEADITLYRQAYKLAPLAEAESLRAAYAAYFELRKESDAITALGEKIITPLQPLFQGETLEADHINVLIAGLKNEEQNFKTHLKNWLDRNALSAEIKEKVSMFIQADYMYFHGNQFFDTELLDLHEIVYGSRSDIAEHLALVFKGILEKQATYTKHQAALIT